MRTILTIILGIIGLATARGTIDKPSQTESAAELYERGNAYFMAEEYPDALECYLEAMRLADQSRDMKIYSSCTGNIGFIFSIIHDYERGIHYTRITHNLATRNHETEKQRRTANVLTVLYVNLGKIDSAEYYNKVQKSIEGGNDPENNYLSLYNDGLIAGAKGNNSLARFYYERALDYARSHDFPVKYIIQQLTELGKVSLEERDFKGALSFFREAQTLGDSIHSPNMLIPVYELMTKTYLEAGDTTTANIYKHRYAAANDTVIDMSRFNAAKNSLYEYEYEQTDIHISGLNRRLDTYWLAIVSITVILFLTIIFTVFIVRNNRQLKQTRLVLLEKNKELNMQNEKNNRLRDSYLDAVEQIDESKKSGSPDRTRYDAGISEHQLESMVKKITTVLADIDTISNPQFNLQTLTGLVDSNHTYVSWIINETFGKTFKQLLNEYRIKEAAKRLCDEENYGNFTIEAIYESVGYNSASNFIKAFKTVTGMTPSAYKKLRR